MIGIYSIHLSKGHYISQTVTSEMGRTYDSPVSLILQHPTGQESTPGTNATSLTGISAFRHYKSLHLAAHKQQPMQLQHSQMLYLAISWMQAASQNWEGCRYLCEVLQSRRAVGNRRRDRHPDWHVHGGLVLDRRNKSTWESHGLSLESIVHCTCDIWYGRRDTVRKVNVGKELPHPSSKDWFIHYLQLWRSLHFIHLSYEYSNSHERSYTAVGDSDASHKTKPNKF